MANYFMYPAIRPQLSVECTGGANLGNCYNASYYRVTSITPLTKKSILALRDAGFLGYGQEFLLNSPCDGKEVPAGMDLMPCKEMDERTRKIVNENPLSKDGTPKPPIQRPFFVYLCESRVDSGD